MTHDRDTPSTHDAGGRRAPRVNRWRIAAWSAAALVLLLPLVAGAPWTASDYVFAALLILAVGIPLDLVVRKTSGGAYRWAAVLALGTAFLLVWVNGAVGILGSETNDANLLYAGVLAVGFVGALLAYFRPRGMALAMAATALAQSAVAVGALIGGWAGPENGPFEVVAVNGMFVALWAGSAALFREAARERPSTGPAPTD